MISIPTNHLETALDLLRTSQNLTIVQARVAIRHELELRRKDDSDRKARALRSAGRIPGLTALNNSDADWIRHQLTPEYRELREMD
jgi:hypothetical protein